MYRALIIDDEINSIQTLKLLMQKYCPEVKVVASATEPENGLDKIGDYRPDIVFLDISMPQMNGFELLERASYKDFRVVFTTAHAEHAIKAIRSGASDYLLKPIVVDELQDCIRRLTQSIGERQPLQSRKTPKIIELAVRDGIVFLKPDDIIRIEASGSYTTFYLVNGTKHLVSGSMKEFESQLDPAVFFRCHLSHIVNLDKVAKLHSVDGLFAKMSDGSLADIARKNKQLFLEKLKSR